MNKQLAWMMLAFALAGCGQPAQSPVPTTPSASPATFLPLIAHTTMDENIHTNQIGFQPDQLKQVVVSGDVANGAAFHLVDEQGSVAYSGSLTAFGFDGDSGETLARGDFTSLTTPGTYRVTVDGRGASYPFVIANDANRSALRLAARWLYLQRSGADKNDPITGVQHAADHATPALVRDAAGIHPGQTVDASGGWWDAGDYGRYVSPAATTIMSLLYAYRFNPGAFVDGSLNIPESGNGVPDLLDEMRWELEWMLKMQRDSGAVSHKATTAQFTDAAPDQDDQAIYAYDITTQSTAQFAGVMAEASRVYRSIDAAFADRMLAASRRGWDWLAQNPDKYPAGGFQNPPDTQTGPYGAWGDEVDLRLWAAASLFHATGESPYGVAFATLWDQRDTDRQVYGLYWPDGYVFAMVAYLDSAGGDTSIRAQIKNVIAQQTDRILSVIDSTGYHVTLTGNQGEFGFDWGSNCMALNYATYLLLANEITPAPRLVNGAAAQLNWILGVNPMNKAYIAGAGGNPVRHPHHAVSMIRQAAVPGAIGEGPNAMSIGGDPVLQELFDANVPFAKRYADDWRSWATNEPTIYGNAAFVAVAAWFSR